MRLMILPPILLFHLMLPFFVVGFCGIFVGSTSTIYSDDATRYDIVSSSLNRYIITWLIPVLPSFPWNTNTTTININMIMIVVIVFELLISSYSSLWSTLMILFTRNPTSLSKIKPLTTFVNKTVVGVSCLPNWMALNLQTWTNLRRWWTTERWQIWLLQPLPLDNFQVDSCLPMDQVLQKTEHFLDRCLTSTWLILWLESHQEE